MPYLIDSDWIIDHLGNVSAATELLTRLAPEGIAISVITYMEAYQGTLRAEDKEASLEQLEELVGTIPILPISREVARHCAGFREELQKQGKKPNRRALDLLIAATAVEAGLTLVTRNVRDYADIPGIALYSH